MALLAGARFVYMAITFLCVPFYLNWLGDAGYGAYLLHWTFAGYLTLVDLGLPYAGNVNIAKALAEGKTARAKALQSALFGAMCGIAVIAFALYTSFGALMNVLKPEGSPGHLALAGFFAIGGYISAINITAAVTPIINSLEDYRTIGHIQLVNAVLTSLVPFAVTYFIRTPEALLFGNTLGAAMTSVVAIVIVARRLGWGMVTPRFDRQALRELLPTGMSLMAIKVPGVLIGSTDRLVIGVAAGKTALTQYGVPARIPESLNNLYRSAFDTALISVTRAAQDKATDLVRLLRRYSLINLTGGCAAVLIPCSFGYPLLSIWLREHAPAIGPLVMLLLAMNTTFDLFVGTAWHGPIAHGSPHAMVRFSIAGITFRILASYPALLLFGGVGVAAVNVIVTVLLCVPVYLRAYKLIEAQESPMPHVMRGTIVALIGTAFSIVGFLISRHMTVGAVRFGALLVIPLFSLVFLILIRSTHLSPLPDKIERVLGKVFRLKWSPVEGLS